HHVEQVPRLLQGHTPVFWVAALRADVEGDPGEVGSQLGGGGDDLARIRRAGAELAGKRPVAADVGGGDTQVLLGVRLDLEHPAHGRAKASRLGTDDGRVDDQERSGVFLPGSLAGDLEVKLDLGMRIEELLLWLLPCDCGASAAGDATRAVPHQSSPNSERKT